MSRGRGQEEDPREVSLRTILPTGEYDHDYELINSLKYPVTPGARYRKVLSLSALRSQIEDEDVVVISDVHAQRDRLRRVLYDLGLLDLNAARIRPEVQLVQIGDLIDGRDNLDIATLEYGLVWFDKIICGNHEAAYLNGPDFAGWQPNPTLSQMLRRALWEEKLVASMSAHGVFLTHAGTSTEYWHNELDPADLERATNTRFREWADMLNPGRPYPELFAVGARRGGSNERAGGGIMWVDWKDLLTEQDEEGNTLRQIVGHSPCGRMEESLNSNIINIDVAGARLGVALVKKDGSIITASDYLPD